jgi:6-phosphogluconolactonase
MSWTTYDFDDKAALIAQLAPRICRILQNAINDRGVARMAVSGGRSPAPLFDALAQIDMPWPRVTVSLVDERWVPPDHEDSNELLVRTHLLQHCAAAAAFVGMKTDAEDPYYAQLDVCARLQEQAFPLDLAILGMGGDGHTASWFPDARELADALDSGAPACCAVTPGNAPQPRMTLTLPAVLGARHRILHLTGMDKHAVLHRAMEYGPVAELPVRALLHQPLHPIDIYFAPD